MIFISIGVILVPVKLGRSQNKVFQSGLVERSGAHCVHSLGYHLVWCTKYRHPVLVGEPYLFVKHLLTQVCQANDFGLVSVEVMPDHVHLFVQLSPCDCVPDVVRLFKSTTAVAVFSQFPELKGKRFWGSGLWSRGYYVSTVGKLDEEVVKRYVDGQLSKPYKVSHE